MFLALCFSDSEIIFQEDSDSDPAVPEPEAPTAAVCGRRSANRITERVVHEDQKIVSWWWNSWNWIYIVTFYNNL